MKIYKVKVNGKIYEVELEEVIENDEPITKTTSDSKNTSPDIKNNSIKSPMQGTIQKILVKPNQKVEKGDSLIILEAMKLENDITADKDYKIIAILVEEGDTVNSDQPLLKVE
ncbi:MAG: biotin/lipoyl-binding protein [Candidatus Izimaplasma sp.]|nr:biotin/lipoyl-binding protein [Candidatus Izimaplasma bacterium]